MMAQDRAESIRVTISCGSLIDQFPLDSLKSIRQLERTLRYKQIKQIYIVQ